MVRILIKKFDKNIKLPTYKTSGSSGMDLMAYTKKKITVYPGKTVLIPTGISVAIPKNYEIQIRPRSGLAAKNNISVLNAPGTVDSDYRGEIKIICLEYLSICFFVNFIEIFYLPVEPKPPFPLTVLRRFLTSLSFAFITGHKII